MKTLGKATSEVISQTGADQDEMIVRQAQHVLQLVNPQQAAQGKYNVHIAKGEVFDWRSRAGESTFNEN